MKYSKRITELQAIYQLAPEDVFYCMLVAAGAARSEAFGIIFRPSSTELSAMQKGASNLANNKPGINRLIESFKTTSKLNPDGPFQAYQEAKRIAGIWEQADDKRGKVNRMKGTTGKLEDASGTAANTGTGGTVGLFRTKDAILAALESEIPGLRGKERTEVLLKIADLQRMKQEENKEEEQRVHYYLPLKCELCPLKKKEGKTKR